MYTHRSNIISLKAALFGAALLFYSCEENMMESMGEINRNFADRVTQNAYVIHKDSGKLKMELKAPLIEEYTLIDSSYTVMKKGVDIKFWNTGQNKPNFIRANWAKIKDREKLYEGRGNIVFINNDGDTLRTEHIFWDNLNKRIFTKDTVEITRLDGTKNIAKNGLEASEDLKEITLFNNHGVIMYKEEENHKIQKSTIHKNKSTTLINEKNAHTESQMIEDEYNIESQ